MATYDQMIAYFKDVTLEDETVYPKFQFDELDLSSTPPLVGREPRYLNVRLPSRLNSPLIPLPLFLTDYWALPPATEFRGFNQLTLNQLEGLKRKALILNSAGSFISNNVYVQMDVLLAIVKESSQMLSRSSSSIYRMTNDICKDYAIKSSKLDIAQSSMDKNILDDLAIHLPDKPPFLHMILKVRSRLTYYMGQSRLQDHIYESHDPKFRLILYINGVVSIHIEDPSNSVVIILHDRYFLISSQIMNLTFVGPSAYLDYVVTREESIFNFSIISRIDPFRHYERLFQFFREILLMNNNHSLIVQFMKNYETFLSMTADFMSDHRCSPSSYYETLLEMIRISNMISDTNAKIENVLAILFNGPNEHKLISSSQSYSPIIMLSEALVTLTPVEILEVSSFHKFCFYAEIDEVSGIHKYIKRTYTKRCTDKSVIPKMISMFNKEYTISYYKRYKRLPRYLRLEDLDEHNVHSTKFPGCMFDDLETKVNEILAEVEMHGLRYLESRPLLWWRNLRPFNCEDSIMTGSPIEQAKDKRAVSIKGSYSLIDSVKELEDIIRTPDFDYMNIDLGNMPSKYDQDISVYYQGEVKYNNRLTCMLKMKEREQKIEGRLFGMFTVDGKQSISRMMVKSEHTLSFFSGNLMTPEDSKRKKHLHSMAQMLLSSDTYGVMADIEGHNQSMQESNTSELLLSMGLCHGSFDWDGLSRLFSNLNIFYAMSHENKSYVLRGQYGGIEGWYNPVWTLHNLLILKLLKYDQELSILAEAVYSDDVAFVVKLDQSNIDACSNMLSILKRHYASFGLTLKISQTVVSKTRVTLLRQHYINGIRADSMPKRLISVTTMGNDVYHSDEEESNGLSSSCNSSLELSNSILAPTFLKWYRYYHLNLRSFLSSIDTRIDDGIMNLKWFSHKSISVFKRYFDYDQFDNKQWIITDILNIAHDDQLEVLRNHISKSKRLAQKMSVSEAQLGSKLSDFYWILSSDQAWWMIFHIHALLPQSMGGSGLMSLEQMVLTGYRDNISRSLSIIRSQSKMTEFHDMVSLLLTNVLGASGSRKGKLDFVNDDYFSIDYKLDDSSFTCNLSYREIDLVSNNWPESQKVRTSTEIVRSFLLRHFKEICVNNELLNLLEIYNSRREHMAAVINHLRNAFSSKVAKFYGDQNVFLIVEKLLRKVQTTSSLLRRVKKFYLLCKLISNSSTYGIRKMLKRPVFTFGQVNYLTNIQEYLFKRRSIMFPNIKFLDTVEPEVNELINLSDDRDWQLKIIRSRGTYYDEGIKKYNPPLFGNEALYKGEVRDIDSHFKHIREAIMIKVVSVTKWLLYRSDPAKYINRIAMPTNISSLASLNLRSLGYSSFDDYKDLVPLLARSEIEHRIPLLDMKSKAACRSLPRITTRYKCIFNSLWLDTENLRDSNIHFDYFKLRIITAKSISESVGSLPTFLEDYTLSSSYLVRDVQFDYVTDDFESTTTLDYLTLIKERSDIDSRRIRWISDELQKDSPDKYLVIAKGKQPLPITDTSQLLLSFIIKYIDELQKNNLWDYGPVWSSSAWQPFLDQHYDLLILEGIKDIHALMDFIRDYNMKRIAEDKSKWGLNSETLTAQRAKLQFLNDEIDLSTEIIRSKSLMDKYLNELDNLPKDDEFAVEHLRKLLGLKRDSDMILLRALVAESLVKNILVLKNIGNELIVYRELTMALFNKHYKKMASLISNDKRRVLMAKFFLSYIPFTDIEAILINLMNDFENYLDRTSIVINDEELIQSKLTSRIHIKSQSLNLSKYTKYRVISKDVESAIIDLSDNDLKVLSLRRRTALSCSSPLLWDSPLGSEVYQIHLSHISKYKSINLIDNHTTILDLTAGRGEFYLAAKQNGINCISFGRTDIYNQVKGLDEVTYLENFDLNSLSLPDEIIVAIEENRSHNILVCFDLSYTGSKKNHIEDKMIELLDMGFNLVYRYSPQFSQLSNLRSFVESHSMMVSIHYLHISSTMSPNPYIFLSHLYSPEYVLDSITPVKEIIAQWLTDTIKLMKYPQPIDFNHGPYDCSLTELMGEPEEVLGNLSSKLVQLMSNDLIRNAHIAKKYLIWGRPLVIYGGFMMGLKGSCDPLLSLEDLKPITEHSFESFMKLSHDYNIEVKNIDPSRSLEVDINKLSIENLNTLRCYHQIRSVRRLANALYNLDPYMNDRRSLNLETELDNIISNVYPSFGPSNLGNRLLNDTLIFFCYGIMINNHSRVFDILYKVIQRDRRRSDYISKLAKNLRCMTKYVKLATDIVSTWRVDSENYNIIENYIKQNYLNRAVHSRTTYRHTTKTHDVTQQYKPKEDDLELISDLKKMFDDPSDIIGDITAFMPGKIILNLYPEERTIESIKEEVVELNTGGIEDILGDSTPVDIDLSQEYLDAEEKKFQLFKTLFKQYENESTEEWEARVRLAVMISAMED